MSKMAGARPSPGAVMRSASMRRRCAEGKSWRAFDVTRYIVGRVLKNEIEKCMYAFTHEIEC